ncbi:MAG: bifunctional folylpolyglutamate synthase/dihydrofolate synthase [Fimbriimonadaceae bacterium]
MHRLVDVLGIPNGGNRPFIHIAGTNGKGSTVTMVEAMLRSAGFTTGSCVSPYVYSVCERVAVNGESVSESEFLRAANAVRGATEFLKTEGYGVCTVFEVFTAMAFWYWEDQGVDFGVVEVGLGGLLDCTNVIDPVVSAVVSISYDHMEILGGTLEEIALEKAGVIKPGRLCILGDLPLEARKVMAETADFVGGSARFYGQDWKLSGNPNESEFELDCQSGHYRLPKPKRLPGLIQVHNAGVAAQCFLEATEGKLDRDGQIEAMRDGLQNAYLPGRFEVFRKAGRTWVFDGAHNEQSMLEMVRTFRGRYPRIKPNILFGMLNRHDPRPCGDLLKLLGGDVRCVPINWEATEDPEKLADLCGFDQWYGSIEDAIAELDSDVVVVTGSFYLLSDVANVLGLIDRR